ncbi:MAG: SulA-like leucine-rich domain-containing protein [Exilibacterium sp.]
MSTATSTPFAPVTTHGANNRVVQPDSGVTEVVLSRGCPRQLALLLPMLAHLSWQPDNRWITWIAPSGIDRQTLISYGVNTTKIRLIHTSGVENILWMTWEALAKGNSYTVISSPGKITEKAYAQLEKAAARGRAQGLLLRMR